MCGLHGYRADNGGLSQLSWVRSAAGTWYSITGSVGMGMPAPVAFSLLENIKPDLAIYQRATDP